MNEPRLSDLTRSIQSERALDDAVRWTMSVATTKSLNQAREEYQLRAELKTAALEGTPYGGSPSWGSELAQGVELSALAQFSRQLSILGRLGLVNAPFRASVPDVLDDGLVATFRGPGAPKAVADASFSAGQIDPLIIALIIAFSADLARLSNGVSTRLLRTILGRAIARGIDSVFFSATTATADTPGGLFEGLSAVTASVGPVEDLKALVTAFVTAGGSVADAVLVMSSENAIGARLTGNEAFRQLDVTGGSVAGLPAVCGAGASDDVVLIDKSKLLLADEGISRLDSATHASLDMAGGSSPTFNLWQRNCVALRAEQMINWRISPGAVQYVSGADYLAAE